MQMRASLIAAGAAVGLAFAVSAVSPASALTMKECSASYQAAKSANTLNGQSWSQFRKTHCSANAATPAAATAPAAPANPLKPAAPAAKPTTTTAARPAAGAPVFPNAIDPAFAKESAGRARLHTCSKQYQANKATNANGGLKWIEKGGGYWSECNKHLKG